MEEKQNTQKTIKIEDVDIMVLKATAWDLNVEIEERKNALNQIAIEINRRFQNEPPKEELVEKKVFDDARKKNTKK